MTVDARLLVPPPQELELGGEPWALPPIVRIGPLDDWLISQLDAALDPLARELAKRGTTLVPSDDHHGELRLVLTGDTETAASDLRQEAYQLTLSAAGVDLTAHAAVGLFRGLTTLAQWLRLQAAAASIEAVAIVDWPDLAQRGVMLDVSRNRVPTMAQLYALVDLMAELKLNHLQLYFEHSFAYAGHERVWRDASPMRAEQVRRLESYARRRAVELAPNQNSFGHLHRWLIHEPYRRLAECPDGIEHPFSPEPEPFSLCPIDDGSLELLRDLYAQLLPNFASELVNIGLDETLDLGRCRSRQACAERGKGRVYLDFLRRVSALVAEHGRRPMFWADVLLDELRGDPELLAGLPHGGIPMIWGYEAEHDFKTPLERLKGAGFETWICPGTASWNSFTGRPEVARANLARAARQGDGAAGYLITDWGDHGHLQPPPVSWPGYVAGAAFAWNRLAAVEPGKLPLAELLDRHVLRDPARRAGRALLDLGAAQTRTGVETVNGAPLFFSWFFADKSAAERRGAGFEEAGLDEAETALDEALDALDGSRMERPDAELIHQELGWAADATRLGAGLARARLRAGEDAPVEAIDEASKRSLVEKLDSLVERLPAIWLERSRRGGLQESIELFSRLRPRLADPGRDAGRADPGHADLPINS